jgi:chemotaxis signal transduction protein
LALAPKKKTGDKIEARIKDLEDELLALKADYFGAAIDDLRRPKGPFAVITFRAGGKTFALPLWSVKGISRAVAITERGGLGKAFLGVINYHGELVPVLDAAAALGAESRDVGLGDHVIYFTAAGHRVALVVGAVVDVETFDGERVISAGEAGLPRRPFLGAYEQGGTIVRILEPAALLSDFGGAAGDAGGGE